MTANPEHPVHAPSTASAVERAIAFGVDITLLVKNLRLTPTERIQQAQQAHSLILQAQYAEMEPANPGKIQRIVLRIAPQLPAVAGEGAVAEEL